MQTTLLEEKVSELPEEIKAFAYFWNCYRQWIRMNKNPSKNEQALKNFETLHGKIFIQTIRFFANQAGEANA